jgi:uncharacterized protein YqeY
MSLEQKINSDIKTAMRAKDKVRLRGLRAVKSAILLAKTEKGASKSLSDAAEVKLLAKLVKQRKDSAAVYDAQGRADLSKKEREDIEVIQQYLPKQLSADEIKAAVQAIIDDIGATSMRDMGKVMGRANKQLSGKAEGRFIATVVRQLLQ